MLLFIHKQAAIFFSGDFIGRSNDRLDTVGGLMVLEVEPAETGFVDDRNVT